MRRVLTLKSLRPAHYEPKEYDMAQGLSLVFGIACGFAIWALSQPLTGQAEPWDSQSPYYNVALLLAGLAVGLGWRRHFWIGTLGVYLGQVSWVYANIFAAARDTTTRAPMSGLPIGFQIPIWAPALLLAIYVGITFAAGLFGWAVRALVDPWWKKRKQHLTRTGVP